jgi:TonB-linked SusC/RagA family outer membrane protein
VDPDLYPNSIWTDLLSKHTQNQRYTVNIRGGSEKNKFFVSGAFYDEAGIYKSNPIEDYNANIGLKRYDLRSNVDMNITHSTKLSVDMSGQYKRMNDPGASSSDIFENIVLFPTHLVPMRWSDGSASVTKTDGAGRYNPYNLLNYTGYTKSWTASIQSKVALEQQLDFITKGLSIKGSMSFDADFSSFVARTMSPDKYYVIGRDSNGKLIKVLISAGTALGDVSLSSTNGTKNIYIESQLNYNRTFADKHAVQALLVYNQREIQYQNVSGIALLPHRQQNVVFRGTYAYDGRYVVEGSFGATGSENFAPGHRWGIFPAFGVAWNAHAEKFMSSLQNVVNKLRLRASYGITGNDNTGSDRFTYRESLTNSGVNYIGLQAGANGGATNDYGGLYENTFAALDLTWEKERKTNFGLDLGMFRGRIDLTADYFSNRRYDILIERVTIPTSTGFRKNPWQNFGIMSNKGADMSITLKQKFGDVNLSAIGNFTFAKNKVVEMDEVPKAYPWLRATGVSNGTPRVYIADGLFHNSDFNITTNSDGSHTYKLKDGIATYSPDVKPGDIRYKDLNGDGKIDDLDMTFRSGLYPSNPEIVYGFGLNADYKGFYADVFFQGQAKASTDLHSVTDYFIPFALGRDQSSARLEASNHWKANDPDNDNVLYPRLHTTEYANNTLYSTWWYRSASFLRLKNVELGYKFDEKLTRKLKLQGLQLYVQGTNIAVWDHIKLWDPEILNSGATYPICGTWTMGLNIIF